MITKKCAEPRKRLSAQRPLAAAKNGARGYAWPGANPIVQAWRTGCEYVSRSPPRRRWIALVSGLWAPLRYDGGSSRNPTPVVRAAKGSHHGGNPWRWQTGCRRCAAVVRPLPGRFFGISSGLRSARSQFLRLDAQSQRNHVGKGGGTFQRNGKITCKSAGQNGIRGVRDILFRRGLIDSGNRGSGRRNRLAHAPQPRNRLPVLAHPRT